MGKKKPRNSNSVQKRIIHKLLTFLLILGIPAILVTSSFYLKNITVLGSNRYTSDEITGEIIKSKLDSNALYTYLKYKYFTNVTIPFVEKIDIEMVDNHSLDIYVYEKIVIGCVEFMGEYLYFDKDGIIVESSPKRLEDIPLIKGLEYDKIILNEKFEVQKNKLFDMEIQKINLFDVILNLTLLIGQYELNVDTISFSRNYEVTLDCDDIKVQLGKKKNYDEAIAELKNILLETDGMNLTIDMRKYDKDTEAIIAKPKE